MDDFDSSKVYELAERLTAGGKIVWVDGGDDAHYALIPQIGIDAAFRKEINPQHPYHGYGVPVHHLTFAAPSRWFDDPTAEEDRYCDCVFIGNPETDGTDRYECCCKMFQTKRRLRNIAGSCGLGFSQYFNLLKRAKFGLCPAAAAGSESLRNYEVIACGAIPIFIGLPPWRRDPWFPCELICQCDHPDRLPDLLDSALDGHDLRPMRQGLREYALKHHTTAARARKVLEVVGLA
jgi:hypothetical protein